MRRVRSQIAECHHARCVRQVLGAQSAWPSIERAKTIARQTRDRVRWELGVRIRPAGDGAYVETSRGGQTLKVGRGDHALRRSVLTHKDNRRAARRHDRRINPRRELVPDLEQIAIAVARVQVRLAWTKITLLLDHSTGGNHALRCRVDRRRVDETKSKMRDSAGLADVALASLKHQHVARAGRLRLDELVPAIHGDHAEHRFIKAERALDIGHRECEVREPVRRYRFGHTTP